MTLKRDRALERAIREAGGPAALAAHIRKLTRNGITTQAISQWRRCPADRVHLVAAAPGVTVPARKLRPDIFPKNGTM